MNYQWLLTLSLVLSNCGLFLSQEVVAQELHTLEGADALRLAPPLLPAPSLNELILTPPTLSESQTPPISSDVLPVSTSTSTPPTFNELTLPLPTLDPSQNLSQPQLSNPEVPTGVDSSPNPETPLLVRDSQPVEISPINPPLASPIQPIAPTTIPLSPVEHPETPESTQDEETAVDLDPIILETLTSSAERYPYIFNPSDTLTFSAQLFRPNTDSHYGSFDFRFAESNPILNRITAAYFPPSEQFYWVLDNNRIVVETSGWQGGMIYQGQSAETRIHQQITLEQVLWGTQAVWSIPRLPGFSSNSDLGNTSLMAVSGAIYNPNGVDDGAVTLNSGIDFSQSNVTRITDLPFDLGRASTYSARGGSELFQHLSPNEAPLILQAFPTVDISPLAGDNGTRPLETGRILSRRTLAETGISWGNIFTGEPATFTAPITSTPGLHIARLGRFENPDFLRVLVDPTMSDTERTINYLNSLFWTSFGRRTPQFEAISQAQTTEDWYRAYLTHSHHRIAIDYDPVEIQATYSSILANPGISAVFSMNEGIDSTQSINSSVGLALGILFEGIDLNNINHSLDEAHAAREAGQPFATLNTQATSTERRQINQRLNQTLAYAGFTSGLEQVSGEVTFPSVITPVASNLFRIQTGLHRRSVQFLQYGQDLVVGDTFISDLNFSSQDFGPLTFIGAPATNNTLTSIPTSEAFAVDVMLTAPDGQRLVEQYNSEEARVNPLMTRGADLAFDRMELTRIDQLYSEYDSFQGYLSLPALEMTWAGSSHDLSYSLTTGLWVNLNAEAAPGVSHNNLGIQEPDLGLYANGILNLSTTHFTTDDLGNPVSVDSYGPLFRLNWDSTHNLFAALSYSYAHQEQSWQYSINGGVALAIDSNHSQWIGFLNGQLHTASGLEINGGIELNEHTFFNVQALQSINSRLSIGGYLQNSSYDNVGVEQRNLNFSYGALLRYRMNVATANLQLGMSDRGFEARIQGEFQF